MNEFELIDQLQRRVNGWIPDQADTPIVGIGDDAAVLACTGEEQWVVTMDTLVAGVHFPPQTSAADIAHKALAVNLSDLAAMGARPAWFFLGLTLPHVDSSWLEEFSGGLASLAEEAQIQLAGGDTTSGPLSLTITAMGKVRAGQALRRDGARAGDLVVLSGPTGLASFALEQTQKGNVVDGDTLQALNRPSPRLELGCSLAGRASSCIDISDGLAADLSHICKASGVGAEIKLQNLPLSPALQHLVKENLWKHQLAGGDDYELCFTLPPEFQPQLSGLENKTGASLTVIGVMTASPGVHFIREDGSRFIPSRSGFDHFPGLTG